MKLGQAQKAASERLQALNYQRQQLKNLLKDETALGDDFRFDRVEISKALTAVEKEYDETSAVAEDLATMSANIQNAEIARQQGEAVAEAAEDFLKIMEIFRRISKGDRVPGSDEQKLMEYSSKMYLAAKSMALLAKMAQEKSEEHDSLWGDEEPEEDPVDPAELASGTEVGQPLAHIEAAAVPAEVMPEG